MSIYTKTIFDKIRNTFEEIVIERLSYKIRHWWYMKVTRWQIEPSDEIIRRLEDIKYIDRRMRSMNALELDQVFSDFEKSKK